MGKDSRTGSWFGPPFACHYGHAHHRTHSRSGNPAALDVQIWNIKGKYRGRKSSARAFAQAGIAIFTGDKPRCWPLTPTVHEAFRTHSG